MARSSFLSRCMQSLELGGAGRRRSDGAGVLRIQMPTDVGEPPCWTKPLKSVEKYSTA